MKTENLTSDQLRKKASELGIKNYTKFKKAELIILVNAALNEKVDKIEKSREAVKVSKPKSSNTIEIPREGTQAREIYDIFAAHVGHKKWTVYRVAKDNDFSLNNVRRIYKRYFEEKNREIFSQSQEK